VTGEGTGGSVGAGVSCIGIETSGCCSCVVATAAVCDAGMRLSNHATRPENADSVSETIVPMKEVLPSDTSDASDVSDDCAKERLGMKKMLDARRKIAIILPPERNFMGLFSHIILKFWRREWG
jgi:hypothetical protein